MPNCKFVCVCLCAALVTGVTAVASAQTFESVGVRAQGMGGAFVAVADDATATWWNPAGLATGAYLSAVIERGRTTEPRNPSSLGPAQRLTTGDFAVAFPALGLSYYRLRVSEIAGPGSTGAAAADRQDPRGGGSSVRSAVINQFGVTVGQSLGDHLVVGSTLKLLRAGAVSTVSTGAEPLDDADDLDPSRHTSADLDIGAMASLGRLRLGVTVKNVTEPSFGEGADELSLTRQARVGLAISSVPHGALQGVTAAADADLTKTATAVGDVRHVSGGVEGWLAKGRVGVRAGVSANTVDAARPAASVGGSVALTRGFHLNASKTVGRDDSMTGWSASVSVAF